MLAYYTLIPFFCHKSSQRLAAAMVLYGSALALCAHAPNAEGRLYISPDGWDSGTVPDGREGGDGRYQGASATPIQQYMETRPVNRSIVHVLSTQRSVAENIEAWALEEGWRIRWDVTIPPIRPRRTTRYFGSVDHPDGALAMVLDRISSIVDLSAEIHPEERIIAIQEWRAPKWEGQEFQLIDPESGMTLDF